MKDLIYPVWALEDVDDYGVYDLVKKFIELVQCDGDKAHDIANEIGKIAMQRPSSADNLKLLLTADNCKKGMELFLQQRFKSGMLLSLAKEIGAVDRVLLDVKNVFRLNILHIGMEQQVKTNLKNLLLSMKLSRRRMVY